MTNPTNHSVTQICYGKRDAMIAECGAASFVNGKYLLVMVADEQYDTQGFDNLKDAKSAAKEIAAYYGVKIVRIF